MAGALADFSRRPPGVRVAVYVAIALVLGLLYYQVALAPVRKAVKEAEANRDAAINEASALAEQKKKRDALVQAQEDLRKKIEQNQKALPTDAEMPAFFDMLARKFNEAGVQVNRREIKREVQVEEFIKAPVEIEITGTYYQVKQFFTSLRPHADAPADGEGSEGEADKDRIVTVENLQVFDPRVVNKSLIVTARFTASTFRTAVVEPPAAPATPGAPAAGAGSGSAAGSGSGAGSAPRGQPTLGPATSKSPLSADKARGAAENLYKASEGRAREAAAAGDDPLPPPPAPAGSATPPPANPKGGLDRIQGGM